MTKQEKEMHSLLTLTNLALAAAASFDLKQALVPRLRAASQVDVAPEDEAFQQRLQCWDRTSQNGDSVIATDYMPYISYHNMDNKIESCVFNGIWILYGEEVYNSGNPLAHNFWAYGENYATDMPSNFMNEASSLRYSGHPQDMYKDSINMYFNEYFMGDEEFAYQNSPVLNYDNRAQSIIVTGDQWWTIYESANYGGYKACLAPGQDNMPAFCSTMGSLHSLANDISSVAIGCYAKDKFYPDALNVTSRSAHGASGFFGGH